MIAPVLSVTGAASSGCVQLICYGEMGRPGVGGGGVEERHKEEKEKLSEEAEAIKHQGAERGAQ